MKNIKSKKLYFLMFVTIAIFSFSMVSAVTFDHEITYDCNGKITGSILQLTESPNGIALVDQSGNIRLVTGNCTTQLTNPINLATAQSPNDMSSDGGYIYFMGYTNNVPFEDRLITIDDTTLATVKGCYLGARYSVMSAEDGYIYTLSTNGQLNKFDDDCIPLDDDVFPSTITGTPTGLTKLNNDTWLVMTTSKAYEVSADWSAVISEADNTIDTSNGADFSDYDKDNGQITYARDIKTYEVWNVEDQETLPYFVINGSNYSSTICIDDNTLCNDASYLITLFGDIEFICPSVNETEHCSNSCTNTNTGTIIEGVCTQIGCENECNVIDKDTCQTQNTYTKCGQYDADACLEFGSVLTCPANQYCIEDLSLGAYCGSTAPTGDTYTQEFITVNLELDSNTGTLENQGSSNVEQKRNWITKFGIWVNNLISTETYQISTALPTVETTYLTTSYEQSSSQSTDYVAITCEYEEELLFFDDLTHGDLAGNDWTTNATAVTNETYKYVVSDEEFSKEINEELNSVIETIVGLTDDGVYTVTLYNDVTPITTLEINHNSTTFTTTITETVNNEVIVNTTSTSDDLEEIFIGVSYISDINTANIYISLIREVLGQTINENYYSLPIATPSSLSPNKISFDGDGKNLKTYQVSQTTVNDYPIFEQKEESNKLLQCSYSDAGCYRVKSYGNNQGIPTYYFSDEVQTCVTSINGQTIVVPTIDDIDQRSTIEKVLGKQYTQKEKWLFSAVALFLVFTVFGLMSVVNKDPIPMIIGAVITGLLMIYFAVEGFIPIWIVVLFGVIGALIGTRVAKSSLFNG